MTNKNKTKNEQSTDQTRTINEKDQADSGVVNGGIVDASYDKTDAVWLPKEGDTVIYNGTRHYANANAVTGPTCKGGKAKITRIYQLGKSKHPYHLVAVSGSGSTVYGWVNEGSFTKA